MYYQYTNTLYVNKTIIVTKYIDKLNNHLSMGSEEQ